MLLIDIFTSKGFLQEKALPSAGLLPFLQSLFCTYNNNCFNSSQLSNLPRNLEYEQYIELINPYFGLFSFTDIFIAGWGI